MPQKLWRNEALVSKIRDIYLPKLLWEHCSQDSQLDIMSRAKGMAMGFEKALAAGRDPWWAVISPAWQSIEDEVRSRSHIHHAEDVLWIGPLSDGLTSLGVFSRPKGTDKGRWPRLDLSFASFTQACESEGEGTAKGFFNTGLAFERPGQRRVALNYKAVMEEPGEVLNSPTRAPPESGYAIMEWEPRIREDRRFGLHFLLRGDYFLKRLEWKRRSELGQILTWEYRLRPAHEGPSLLTPEKVPDSILKF